MGGIRRRYTAATRELATRLVVDEGLSVRDVAARLEIKPATLAAWASARRRALRQGERSVAEVSLPVVERNVVCTFGDDMSVAITLSRRGALRGR